MKKAAYIRQQYHSTNKTYSEQQVIIDLIKRIENSIESAAKKQFNNIGFDLPVNYMEAVFKELEKAGYSFKTNGFGDEFNQPIIISW